jgi:ATP-binding cassette, subfamily B, bacterial
MTSSPDRLPPALPAMWRVLKLGYRHEPGMMSASFALALLAALPDAFLALWLKLLGQAVVAGRGRLLLACALGLGATATATWFLGTVSTRVQRRFRDRVTIALEAHVARLQAEIATIAHQERPEYLDRLSVLRDQVFVLDHMYMSLFTTCGWVLRLGVAIALLASVHPALIALVVFALPTVLTSAWRPGVERAVEERAAPAGRLARHVFLTATTAAAAKEVRLARIGPRLVRERREVWERWYGPVATTRWTSALWHALAWAVFGSAYVGAIVFVSSVLRAPAGDVLLVLAAGGQLSAYVGAAVGEIGFLRGIWLDGSRRLAWLEDYAASVVAAADRPAPARLHEGIRLEGLSFAYPGTDRLVLDHVDLDLPAGSVVALVGENGAGKTTLVKLLCKLYEPTAGRILVDGVDLGHVRTHEWRQRLAGAFQDFFRFELVARRSVGLGDLHHLDDERAVRGAVDRAGAEDVVSQLPAGLGTQLGPTWPQGVEVSFGQWQKIALARGFMREDPLLLVLDEPTAALDAETEHALFERYAAAARGAGGGGDADGAGRITVLVSHRFGTARAADLVVVLDGSRVAQVGAHEELIARPGPYAELYRIQADAYR